ncbi:MAG: hypothetical protein HKM03_10740 [Steroidobacteraceae bacterium]|nr:hypothetical protein [Steroidobacteraceae bacterium]
MMRIAAEQKPFAARRLVVFAPLLLCTAFALGLPEVAAAHLTRQQLVGAWRLVRIEYSGANGSTVDPFYQPGSTGMLIYDANGWMSVQIAAPHRPDCEVPVTRPAEGATAADVELKAAAFDTYYAYYGTWDFDAKKSQVTHHVVSSLIPAENGVDYTQQVAIEGRRMIFTTRVGRKGAETIHRKIWERIGTSPQNGG